MEVSVSLFIGVAALACFGAAGWSAYELITVSFAASRGLFISQATIPVILGATGVVLVAAVIISEQIEQIQKRLLDIESSKS